MSTEEFPSARMIRAARGLLNIDQTELAALVNVSRRTIIRIEGEEGETENERRIAVLTRIRDELENNFGIRFIYANSATGEGVVMNKGK